MVWRFAPNVAAFFHTMQSFADIVARSVMRPVVPGLCNLKPVVNEVSLFCGVSKLLQSGVPLPRWGGANTRASMHNAEHCGDFAQSTCM